jgi:hypothetical protein
MFLTIGTIPDGYSATQKKNMVVCVAQYHLITIQLYNLVLENILRRCILDHERPDILWECHSGVAGGHVGGKETSQKILQEIFWWPTMSNMIRITPEHVMSIRELVICHVGTSFPYILFRIFTLLRKGKLNL